MANNTETDRQVQPWMPSTVSLPALAAKSRAILQCATSHHEAAKAAKTLIGQWPHARPPNPEAYAAAITATLGAYPRGLVDECCDPVHGLARAREFPPTVAAIVEWCERRLAFHVSVANWQPRLERPAEPEYSDDHCAEMRKRIAEIPGTYFRHPAPAGEGRA